jgi:sec-independent protein translocase protein TatA
MGPIGIQELVLIFVVALLIFGPKKLPELGRSLGKTLGEFRRASNEIKQSIERELEQTEEEKK